MSSHRAFVVAGCLLTPGGGDYRESGVRASAVRVANVQSVTRGQTRRRVKASWAANPAPVT
jgi:hypothetical protein